MLDEVLAGIEQAPFFDPTMPRTGKKFSVRMTNFGPLGWVSDAAKGYRYEPVHPATGQPWPPIPDALLRLWDETTALRRAARSVPRQFLWRQRAHGSASRSG